MAQLNLERLTKGEVRMLTGHARGVHARDLFHLDELDALTDVVSIIAPIGLDTVTPSFVQGLLAKSLQTLGPDRFKHKYDLSALPSIIQQDFLVGMDRLLRRPNIHSYAN